MSYANGNYLNLEGNYLFSDIAKRVKAYSEANPDKKIIRLGIGDVTRPIVPAIVNAIKNAAEEMGIAETFRGYGPEQGYDFLRNAICKHDFNDRGIDIQPDEIFVSDGAKTDMGNIGDIFDKDNVVLISDPVYPVYVDTNIMAGREIRFAISDESTGFVPQVPDFHSDIIYICSPNNPTGSVMTRSDLEKWVAYARKNNAVILFDAAYESYISNPDIPKSIFEIAGARDVAIEFRSFSKTAGFTGLRCAYAVVPKGLERKDRDGRAANLNALWNRRHTTKFNGVSYIIQRAAEAVYTKQGQKEIKENIAYYMENAKLIKSTLVSMGYTVFGGENAPYIWLKCPKGMSSWEFFDYLLNNVQIVGTPGAGFGKAGEGFFRLTAFGTHENTKEALERIKTLK